MLRRSALLCIIFLLGWETGGAQIPGTDSIFKAGELIYFSSLEKSAFNDFLEGKPDYLSMISAINPQTDEREVALYRDWVDEIIGYIREKKFDGLSEEKKIERIKKYVSKALLLNYENSADFDDLFRFGDFNYYTAAAVYSFLLDQLGIPYKIFEEPTQIYLVAYPASQGIRIETTKPGHQYFMFDHETRVNFVEYMRKVGVIDDYAYRNTSIRNLFEQYYFAGYGLSIREMIGMLYINSAIEMMLLDQTKEAYAQLEKAFILHPSYKSQYLLLLELNRYLVTMDYRDPLSLGYLIKASRLVGYGIEREIIENYLKDIVNTVLVKEEDREGFMFIYEYLTEYLRDEELKNDFSFLYLYESGRMEFNDTRYGKAMDYLELAHALKPGDEQTQDLLARSLGGYSLAVSPGIVMEKIRLYDTIFPEITKEGIYMVVKTQTCLSLFGEAFQLKDRKSGESYMKEFERLMDANPETEIDHLLIGRSYSSAAIFYYREGQVSKSRQVIEKGLKYAPDNIELKLKLKAFNSP
jgi:hypothetical protein